MKKIVLLTIGCLALTACDCIQSISGTVRDSVTHEPLTGVSIHIKSAYTSRMETDSTGHFGYRGISGGLFGCPRVVINFSKEGYADCKRSFSSFSSGEVVELKAR